MSQLNLVHILTLHYSETHFIVNLPITGLPIGWSRPVPRLKLCMRLSCPNVNYVSRTPLV